MCKTFSFDMDGQTMGMVQYFAEKKNIRVNGNLPAVVNLLHQLNLINFIHFQRQQNDRDVRNSTNYFNTFFYFQTLFPMACIHILPNQRLPLDRMSENIISELLKVVKDIP